MEGKRSPWGKRFFTGYMSLRRSLMLAFVLLILLPYLLTTTYYTASMYRQLQRENESRLTGNVAQLSHTIDTMFSETERVAYLHFVDQDIARVLQTHHEIYGMQYMQDETLMMNAIKHAVSLNNNILSVSFHTRQGNVYRLNHLLTTQSITDDAWVGRLLASPDHTYVAPMTPFSNERMLGEGVLSILYSLYDTLGTTYLGYVRVDYDFRGALQRAIQGLEGSAGYALLQDGLVMYNDTALSDDALLDSLGDGDNAQAMISSQHDPRSRLTLVATQPFAATRQPAFRTLIAYLAVLGVTLLLDLLTAAFIASRTGASLRELTQAMDRAEHGQTELLDMRVRPFVNSEINALKRSYNAMVQRLQGSMAREIEARGRQNAIALRVLESQINPHFLFNTLNLIASLAQLGGQEPIRVASISLAEMLRYSIKEGAFVTLQEELAQTAHYINILKLRFPDRLVIRQDVDAGLLGVTVPKLLIQPLLENAAKYATETTALVVLIDLRVQRVDDEIHITIADNGPGIQPDALADIRLRMQNMTMLDQTEGNRSMGLINVHARVQAYYGEPYGVVIDSSDAGCTVTIRLPADTTPHIP